MTKIAATDQLWLMKSEPDVYGWDDLVAEGEGTWDGVRNHLAARKKNSAPRQCYARRTLT